MDVAGGRCSVRACTKNSAFTYMAADLVAESLAALSRCADPDARAELLRRTQHRFLEHPGDAANLVRRIAGTSPEASLEDPLSLLAAILDEARMAEEMVCRRVPP